MVMPTTGGAGVVMMSSIAASKLAATSLLAVEEMQELRLWLFRTQYHRVGGLVVSRYAPNGVGGGFYSFPS